MRRTINGVPFIVESPSKLVLDAFDDGSEIKYCTLWFDGFRWTLDVLLKQGAWFTKDFRSRDEAVSAMRGRP